MKSPIHNNDNHSDNEMRITMKAKNEYKDLFSFAKKTPTTMRIRT